MAESILSKDKRLDMTLDDRLTVEEGWVYMTGMQALVRLPVQQRIRDIARGLDTAGFISGYRGSPLGRYDMELWNTQETLESYNIVFKAGVNEDLAATAAWGSQYVGTFPGATVDGVFSIWYGKAPGMDRSMDALRHANMAGTSPLGGSLLLVGDDHGAKSSTLTCYSDFNFVSAGIPLLAPSNAQEVLDFGLQGIAMSRHSGLLCGIKLVTDVIEGGGSIYVGPNSPEIVTPDAKEGLSIQTFTPFVQQEEVLYEHRIDEALIYARQNKLNAITQNTPGATLGIVAASKAYQDLSQALRALGVSDADLGSIGLKVLKVGMVWPLDDQIVREFAQGLDTILVVEEKRPLLEDQIRSILYGEPKAPSIVGKFFDGQTYATNRGDQAFPNSGEINPSTIVRVLSKTALNVDPNCGVSLPNFPDKPAAGTVSPIRSPSFCAGCPHGRSTQVVEGSRALAGIGCHSMAMFVDPSTTNTISHMGGEGAMWIGQQPFTDEKHVFTNMGDGTYYHSGFMAIRAAVAADLPITYKLLVNGFMSMTGGQPIEGELSIDQIIGELYAEGVRKITLVSDEPEKYDTQKLPGYVDIYPRTKLELVQKDLREYDNVSVLIYEQPCATERRRLRKRGKWEDPDKRVFINPSVCEGCGDCGAVSNCMAIEPLETEFGRKRQINQSSCNKDFSCVEGFCPSLVTIEGATPKKSEAGPNVRSFPEVPEPILPSIDGSWSVLVAGIGGTGVVTIGQTLAVAAHADGLFSSNLDVTGLAQKYGAVLSHIKIANDPVQLNSTRIATGEADALIGADIIVSAGDEVLATLVPGQSNGVVSTHLIPTAEFARNPDWNIDERILIQRLDQALEGKLLKLDSILLAERILGDAVYANTLLLGAAWQLGAIPVSLEALVHALDLNGVAVEMNIRAFALGRYAAHDLEGALALIQGSASHDKEATPDLDSLIERRVEFLTQYQNVELANKYRQLVDQVRRKEADLSTDLTVTHEVARYYFKVLAHKDEWEVARLYADPTFTKTLAEKFDGDLKLTFHVGGWPFGQKVPDSKKVIKRAVGGWMMSAFKLMASLRGLRGSWLDPFRNSNDAQAARALIKQYESDIAKILDTLSPHNLEAATRLAAIPDQIRGYGHVREEHATRAATARSLCLAELLGAPAEDNLIAKAS
ncbi:MAG: indolepyruvate ferredoxin oxidoreductase family protein [Pseudomonadales bacterium]|nr:indolepyruvate ferredoxin oxidoreductase family protein [Pseudomonadales bacterium]